MFTSFEMMKICFQRQGKSHQEMTRLLKTLEIDAEKECGINSEQTAPEEQQIPPKNQSFEGSINLATEICVAVIKRFKKKIR